MTDSERVALTLAALGEDITSFDGVNLVNVICSNGGLTASANNLVYALIAFDEANVSDEALLASGSTWTRAKLVSELLAFQNVDGGFTIEVGGSSNIDMTAMALQALAPHVESGEDAAVMAADARPSVSASVESALSFLKGQMNGLCDFGSVESNAQVLLALVALGKDPANAKNGFAKGSNSLVTAIAAYEVGDGKGYAHTMGSDGKPGNANALATVQALRALSAYKAARSGVSWAKIGNVQVGTAAPSGPVTPVTPEVPTTTVPTPTPTPAAAPVAQQSGNGTSGKQSGSDDQKTTQESSKAEGSAKGDSGKKKSDAKASAGKSGGSAAKASSASVVSARDASENDAGMNPVAVAGVVVGIVCLAVIGAWFVRSRRAA